MLITSLPARALAHRLVVERRLHVLGLQADQGRLGGAGRLQVVASRCGSCGAAASSLHQVRAPVGGEHLARAAACPSGRCPRTMASPIVPQPMTASVLFPSSMGRELSHEFARRARPPAPDSWPNSYSRHGYDADEGRATVPTARSASGRRAAGGGVDGEGRPGCAESWLATSRKRPSGRRQKCAASGRRRACAGQQREPAGGRRRWRTPPGCRGPGWRRRGSGRSGATLQVGGPAAAVVAAGRVSRRRAPAQRARPGVVVEVHDRCASSSSTRT